MLQNPGAMSVSCLVPGSMNLRSVTTGTRGGSPKQLTSTSTRAENVTLTVFVAADAGAVAGSALRAFSPPPPHANGAQNRRSVRLSTAS